MIKVGGLVGGALGGLISFCLRKLVRRGLSILPRDG